MADAELSRWLTDHAVEVAGDEGDLDPLRASLAEVRLLGIGEAVVGTRELVVLARRVVELLVAAPGVRTVALGAPESATVVVDEAVRGAGHTDPARALEGMADWRWGTGDVQVVVDRLARHNAERGPDEQVRLVGVDPVSPAPSVKAVGRHLRAVDPGVVDAVGANLQRLLAHRPEHAALPPEVGADAARVAERVADAPGALPRHGRAIARAGELATSATAERAAVRARLATEALEAAVGDDMGGSGPRAVWWADAHDVRVRLDEGGVPSVGARLRERHGRGYYALGLLVGQGEFRARRRRRVRGLSRNPLLHRLAAPPPGTVEAAFGTASGTRLVDLRGGADREGTPAWVDATTSMRILADPTPVGWKRALEPATPAEYDGLAYVARSHQAAVR